MDGRINHEENVVKKAVLRRIGAGVVSRKEQRETTKKEAHP